MFFSEKYSTLFSEKLRLTEKVVLYIINLLISLPIFCWGIFLFIGGLEMGIIFYLFREEVIIWV